MELSREEVDENVDEDENDYERVIRKEWGTKMQRKQRATKKTRL